MPAQYALLDGRRYVNEDFVNGVRDVYPATTKKIPLGYSTYTGWTGKDEVLFTQQEPAPDVKFEGPIYQVTFDPSHPECFEREILGRVEHSTLADVPLRKIMPLEHTYKGASRRRMTANLDLDRVWGPTLEGRLQKAAAEREARRGGGLYGYPRPIQSACETAVKRLMRKAASVARKIAARDRYVLAFLEHHAQRSNARSARLLLAAYRNSLPQVPPRPQEPFHGGPTPDDVLKLAASGRLGLYGFPAKTARLGLKSCALMREEAGVIAADLHRRKAAAYEKITGFFGEHTKTAQCDASDLILRSYPEPGFKYRRRRASVEGPPATVDEWLSWEPPSSAG